MLAVGCAQRLAEVVYSEATSEGEHRPANILYRDVREAGGGWPSCTSASRAGWAWGCLARNLSRTTPSALRSGGASKAVQAQESSLPLATKPALAACWRRLAPSGCWRHVLQHRDVAGKHLSNVRAQRAARPGDIWDAAHGSGWRQ